MKKNTSVPQNGFYYHYKHDTNGSVNNYAYEVIGVGHHTEEDRRPEDIMMVVYRPLYEDAFVYKNGKMFDLRPLAMFMENIEKDGRTFPRFKKITHPAIIAQLKDLRKTMYGE
jgi:hypothetical protein